jgi:hypothetical protein
MSAPDLVGKPAPTIELRRAIDGEPYKVPIGSKASRKSTIEIKEPSAESFPYVR